VPQYSRIHLYGQGANYSDKIRQNDRTARKTRWANQNPHKLVKPEDLAAAIKELEKNPPIYNKKSVKRRRKGRGIDANVPTRSRRRRKAS
jgi:hypothetical protein